jgi:hypothetical protein
MIPHVRRSYDPIEPQARRPKQAPALERSVAVGAKTLAGIGLGVVGVLVGAATLGIALEAIVVPSLLIKLAGGIAGGSLGLAKGIEDERKHERQAG